MNQPTLRQQAREKFLSDQGWGDATVQALAADASFRRYFRLRQAGQQCLLMDAPPPEEDVTPFVLVANHLTQIGGRPPKIFSSDAAQGFVLLEDLGDNTFTRLLNKGIAESKLYPLAVDALIGLHRHPENREIEVPNYDLEVLLREVGLLVDWYLPAVTGRAVSSEARAAWSAAWGYAYDQLPILPDVLVLRDFHVDNLMGLDDGQCALLDFQDALIGSPAYDLASLLEDARRDIPESLQEAMLQRFLQTQDVEPALFDQHFRFWAAQRHAKVLGIFLRLWLRDGKSVYLEHVPRVLALFLRRLSDVELAPVAHWLQVQFPELEQPLIENAQLEANFLASNR